MPLPAPKPNGDDVMVVTKMRFHRQLARMMDDLAAELRLRGLEPPYGAVEQQLADRSAQTKEAGGLSKMSLRAELVRFCLPWFMLAVEVPSSCSQ
jgi:hypothetical protein